MTDTADPVAAVVVTPAGAVEVPRSVVDQGEGAVKDFVADTLAARAAAAGQEK